MSALVGWGVGGARCQCPHGLACLPIHNLDGDRSRHLFYLGREKEGKELKSPMTSSGMPSLRAYSYSLIMKFTRSRSSRGPWGVWGNRRVMAAVGPYMAITRIVDSFMNGMLAAIALPLASRCVFDNPPGTFLEMPSNTPEELHPGSPSGKFMLRL